MTVRLSDVERGYARDGDGITMRGRWYSEASVERILAARLAEAVQAAEQRHNDNCATTDQWRDQKNRADDAEQRALLAAADALNKRWYEKEAEMPNTHATSCWLDGHESAEQFVRSLAAQQRDGGGSEVEQRPAESDAAPIVRGWLTYPDGSMTGIERWVKHADGDWVSLDSSRRTSRDIHMDLGAGVNAPDVPTALPGFGAEGSGSAPTPASSAEPVDRAHSCPDGKCKERHERAWGG